MLSLVKNNCDWLRHNEGAGVAGGMDLIVSSLLHRVLDASSSDNGEILLALDGVLYCCLVPQALRNAFADELLVASVRGCDIQRIETCTSLYRHAAISHSPPVTDSLAFCVLLCSAPFLRIKITINTF